MAIPNSGGLLPAPEVYPRSAYDDVDGDESQGHGHVVIDQDESGYL